MMVGLLLVLAAMALMPVGGMARDRDDFLGDVPPPPPEPNPLDIEVPRGGAVWITLSAYSLTSPIIRYRIKRGAKAGQLGVPQMVTADTGRVKYMPPAGAGPGRDSFSFEVQSLAGVSAPAEVHITITDKEPVLITPNDLEFGQLLPGESAKRSLVMQNIGGGLAEGTVQVPDGWVIDGSAEYRLGAGEKQTFTLIFKPAKVRAYTGDIQYTGNPERATDLNGEEVAPLAVTSGTVELREAGEMRIGTIHVENRTDGDEAVRVKPGPRLDADASVTAPARGGVDILVRAKGGEGEINDSVTVTGEGLQADVPVHGLAVEAMEAAKQNIAASTPAPVPARVPGAPVPPQALSAAPVDNGFGGPSLPPLADELLGNAPDARLATPVRGLAIEGVGQSTAVASSDFKGAKGVRTYRMEVQTVGIDSQGKPVPIWSVFDRASLETEGTVVRARMQNLQPGTLYVVRLVGQDEKGNMIERSAAGRVWTAAEKKGWNWWWVGAGVAGVGAVGFWVWRKRGIGWA